MNRNKPGRGLLFLVANLYLAGALVVSVSIAQVPRKKAYLTKLDREAWRKILKIPADCEESFQSSYRSDSTNFGALEFNRLSNSKFLVSITCYGGAYQPGFIYAYYDEGKPSSTRLLKLKGFETEDDDGKSLPYSLINGFDTLNERTRELEVFSKYRGPGDCGLFVRYKFVGSRPVVEEARKQDCDDKRMRPTTDYRRWPRKRL